MLPAALLLLAASVTLFDDKIVVPSSEWRAVELKNISVPSRVDCVFTVTRGGSEIRVMLMTYLDLQKMRDGKPHATIAASEYANSGSFAHLLEQEERYVVVLDNRLAGGLPAEVRLRIRANSENAVALAPRYASSERQIAVIATSITFFLVVVAYSLQQWRRRQ